MILKLIITFYLSGVLYFAAYFLLKGFFGVIENPDEGEAEFLNMRKEHPAELFFACLKWAVFFPYYLFWLQKQYNAE